VSAEQLLFHLNHHLLGIAARAIGVLFRLQVSFNDRFQYQHRCYHADPIPHIRVSRSYNTPSVVTEFSIGRSRAATAKALNSSSTNAKSAIPTQPHRLNGSTPD
jgi:hypothetical protein